MPGSGLLPGSPGESARNRRDTDDHRRGGAAGGRHGLPAPGPGQTRPRPGMPWTRSRRHREHDRRGLPVRVAMACRGSLMKRGRHGRTVGRSGVRQPEEAERCPRRRLAVKFIRRWCGAQRGQDVRYRPEHHRGVAGLTGQQRIEVSLARRRGALDRQKAVWHFIVRNVKFTQSVTPAREATPAGPSSVSSLLRPRCAITRTLPGVFPSMPATASVSSPATTRSMITSACSGGSRATSAIAASVARLSSTIWAVSGVRGTSARVISSSGSAGCRLRSLTWSSRRRRAVVKSHARQAASSPVKRASPRTTWTQVSAAMSSAPSGASTRR